MSDQPGADDLLAALARDIERATRALAGLTARADQADAEHDRLEHLILDLAKTVQSILRPTGPPAGSWLLGPPVGPPDGPPPPTTAEILDDLAAWLQRIYLRYPDTGLPSCWAWHPCVIEELLWLRRAHHEAHSARTGTATKIGEWHERWRPGVVRRIAGYVGDCELSRHRAGRDRYDEGPPSVPLARYLDAVAGAWGGRERLPDPTASMLAEAAQHDVPVPA